MSEGPFNFGIWIKIKPGESSSLRKWLAVDLGISELMAHQLFVRALNEDSLVEIHTGYGWLEIPKLIAELPSFVDQSQVLVSVSHVIPSRSVDYCDSHQVYYWKGDCPVCSDDYISLGRCR